MISHRDNDTRNCGATTIVTGQDFVTINGQLWSVEGDKCSHGGGDLVSTSGTNVTIEGKKVIVVGDTAIPDLLDHVPPQDDPATGSDIVNIS